MYLSTQLSRNEKKINDLHVPSDAPWKNFEWFRILNTIRYLKIKPLEG